LREKYSEFQSRNTEVLAVAPDTVDHARTFFQRESIPFPCLADPDRKVFRQFDVKSAMISLGQRPGLFVIDGEGVVRYAHLGFQQWEIPTVEETLKQIDALG